MMNRIAALLGAAIWICLVTPFTAQAKTRVEVMKKLTLVQTTTPPTFTPIQRPYLLDRGKHLYLGRGLFAEQDRFFLLRTSDLERVEVRAPIAEFLAENPKVCPGAKGAGWRECSTEGLLFYDSADGLAGIAMSRGHGEERVMWMFLWDLKAGKITAAFDMADEDLRGRWLDLAPLGYDPERKEGLLRLYYLRPMVAKKSRGPQVREEGEGPYVAGVAAVGRKGKRGVARFELKRNLRDPPYFDPIHRRALVVEYAEAPLEGPEPLGYLVDLDSGLVASFPVPLTTYAAAFHPDGKKLYAYSNQTGVLRVIGTDGKKLKEVPLKKRGHALGYFAPGKLLMLNHAGFYFLDDAAVKSAGFYSLKKIIPGYRHVEGSVVAPGRVYLTNRNDLFVVKVGDK